MKLPHLDQLVPLERGEAGLLAKALTALVRELTYAQEPVPLVQMLTFTPLAALARKLHQLHLREQVTPVRPTRRPPKPRQLRVSYDQLVALMVHRARLCADGLSEEENLQVRVLVGKFQQKTLNLSQWIRFK